MAIHNPPVRRTVPHAMARTKAQSLHPDVIWRMPVPPKTEVSLLRKGSKGIRGTLANIDHHAQSLEGMVLAIAPHVLSMNLQQWKQGHNIHVFVTKDGRTFDIVPLKGADGYCGLELRIRVSRGSKLTLLQLTDIADVGDFVWTMCVLFAPPNPKLEVIGGGMTDCN